MFDKSKYTIPAICICDMYIIVMNQYACMHARKTGIALNGDDIADFNDNNDGINVQFTTDGLG